MKRWIFGGLMGTLLAAPAFAGTVYVPVAMDVQAGDLRVRTQMWIGNQGTVGRSATSVFLAGDTDGTAREGLEQTRLGVIAGATIFVAGAAAEGQSGMLEVSAAPQLAVRAQLQSLLGGVVAHEVALPVVSSDNLIAAGTRVQLLPLSRLGGKRTDLVLLNLGFDAATCTVARFRSNGGAIGATSQVQLKALSVRRFADVLADLGDTPVAAARALVDCDRNYYALAVTADGASGHLTVIEPAASGASTLSPPGTEPPPGPCPAGAECFAPLTGSFVSTRSNPNVRLVLPVTKNVEFNQLVVELDVTHGGWFARNPDGIHNFFYLTRTGTYDGHTYGFITTRGPGRNFVRNEYTVDLPRGQSQKFTQPVVLVPGTTYRVRYVYDFPARRFTVVFTDLASGQVVVDFSGPVSRPIRTQGGTWRISLSDLEAEARVPSLGWTFNNLKVRFLP